MTALLDLAFGPGRRAKTAERLREGNRPVAELCLVAYESGHLRASVEFWPVLIGHTSALLLGPLAVDPAHRGREIGLNLMAYGLEKAKALGHALVILVGDEPYYAKVGFFKAPGMVRLPGPVRPERVLIRALKDDAADGINGLVSVPRDTIRR